MQKVIKYTFKVRKSVKRKHTYLTFYRSKFFLMLLISSYDFLKDLGSNGGLFDKLKQEHLQVTNNDIKNRHWKYKILSKDQCQ